MSPRACIALWRHLCDEALRRESTGQGTDAALSALLKGMTDYSVSSSPGNVASFMKTAELLSSGVHDCPHIFGVVGSTGGWYLEEEQKRMSRETEEIEGVTLLQVHDDPVLKRNEKLYHSFVRDLKSRDMLSATCQVYFCAQINGGCVLF